MMTCLVDRPIPPVPGDDAPAIPRHALLYPLRPGTGAAADGAFRGDDRPRQPAAPACSNMRTTMSPWRKTVML
jgi:hypothetical protein